MYKGNFLVLTSDPVKETRHGVAFDFLNPSPKDVLIDDIVFSLSNICRFTGHVEFYSVAQHSVLVSQIVPPEYALEGLMHDASEAYLGDVHSPLKRQLSRYVEIERGVSAAIEERFGLCSEPPEVKKADLILLATEHRDLFSTSSMKWEVLEGIECMPERINPLPPKEAMKLFAERFHELYSERHGKASCGRILTGMK